MSRLFVTGRLAGRLSSGRDAWAAALLVALPLAMLLAIFIVLHALTLSGEQQADRDLGRFTTLVNLGSTSGPVAPDQSSRANRALLEIDRRFPGTKKQVVITTEFSPARGLRYLPLIEADWSSSPYPRRFRLLSGRWPSRPGEVVLSRDAVQSGVPRPVLDMASGRVQLRVVGVIEDRFETDAGIGLTAAGTWNGLPLAELASSGFSPSAGVQVIGDFDDAQAARDIARQAVGDEFPATVLTVTRAQLLAAPARSAIERRPLAYRAPAVGLAFAGTALLLGLALRRHRRTSVTLQSIGLRPWQSIAAPLLSTVGFALLALPAGALAGFAAGIPARALAGRLATQPLSPPAGILGESVRHATMVAVACAAFFSLGLVVAHRRAPRPQLSGRGSDVTNRLRRLLGGVALVAVAFMAPGAASLDDMQRIAWAASIAVIAFVPDVLSLLSSGASRVAAAPRLALRRAARAPVKASAMCAVMVVMLAPLVTNAAIQKSANDLDRSEFAYFLPKGQYAIGSSQVDMTKPPDAQGMAVAAGINGRAPVVLRAAFSENGRDFFVVTPGGRVPRLRPPLMVAPSVDAIRQLLGSAMTPAVEATLRNGGVVAFGDGQAHITAPLGLRKADAAVGTLAVRATRPVAIELISEDRAWSIQASGFLTAGAARRLGLPSRPALGVFPVTRPGEQTRVREALVGAGRPVSVLQVRQEYSALPESPAAIASRYGLAGILAVIGSVALMASARALRRDSAMLLALGLRPRWAQVVLIMEMGTLVVVGIACGLLASGLVFGVALLRTPLPFTIPFGLVALVGGVSAFLVGASAVVALLRLTPRSS